jgi:chromosome transmission fidelity protein 1
MSSSSSTPIIHQQQQQPINNQQQPINNQQQHQQPYIWCRPFPPYPIQHELMIEIYKTLQQGQCGIFESPTGSGKTLSIISAVIPWIRTNWNRNEKPKSNIITTISSSSSSSSSSSTPPPSWISDYQTSLIKEKKQRIEQLTQERYERHQIFLKTQGGWKSTTTTSNTTTTSDHKRLRSINNSSSIILDDDSSSLDSDQEQSNKDEEERLFACRRKIFYCSRTHSQLGQFLQEVKTCFGNPTTTNNNNHNISAIALGSRTHLCTNIKLKQQCKSVAALNTACLESQDGTRKKCECKRDEALISHLADEALITIHQVEDLQKLGETYEICSYYAAREALLGAEVVALPYSMLLQESTRSSLNIDLRGHVVVCDEAHNLVDAIADAHSVRISLQVILDASAELSAYLSKYRNQNLNNAMVLQELITVCEKLHKFLRDAPSHGLVLELDQFIIAAKLSNNNLFALIQKIHDIDVSKKMRGIARELWMMNNNKQTTTISSSNLNNNNSGEGTALLPLLSFLDALNSRVEDGRVSIVMEGLGNHEKFLKFMLMNPASRFSQVVRDAHSVILTGGTMHPIDDMIVQLFPNDINAAAAATTTVNVFSCGHVIPKENLLVVCGTQGPNRQDLTLTFKSLNNITLLDEIGYCVLDIIKNTPQGMVVFFPSYRVQTILTTQWRKTLLLDEMSKIKPIVQEDGGVESCWDKYVTFIGPNRTGEAVLFAVMGGKLSEGINFSDGLARCVVVIGLPYPNKEDPELVAKMKYLGVEAGNTYYDNQCWKTVNQSVGRSIRHINDFAAVVLLDARYGTNNAKMKLPKWIREQFHVGNGDLIVWKDVLQHLQEFFKSKKL